MDKVFGFFLRLLVCFISAKFILQAVGLDGWRRYLVGLTLLFLANVYGLEYLVFREGLSFHRLLGEKPLMSESRAAAQPGETGTPPSSDSPSPGPSSPDPAGSEEAEGSGARSQE